MRYFTQFFTHKIIPDIVEVFAIFVECLFKEIRFRCTPFLHFVATQHGTTRRHQRAHRWFNRICVLVECVHGVELEKKGTKIIIFKKVLKLNRLSQLTKVISRLAAAADMWRDGCLTELLQSRALAKVPTDLETTRNWSIFLSFKLWCGVHMSVSSSSMVRPSVSPSFNRCWSSVWYRLPTRISPLSAKRVFWVGSKTRQ